MNKGVSHLVARCLIMLATAGLVVGMMVLGLSDKDAAKKDFIEYWAAGQQLVRGANPYDATEVLRLESGAGLVGNEPQVTFSPPLGLALVLPLGLVSAKTGLILWLLALISSLLLSIWMIWVLNGRPDSAYHFCGYMFAPAVACFITGQIGIFLLLGIVLFSFFMDRRPYLAGAALLPCAWKPHLFLPFFVVLFLWSLRRKEFRILVTFFAAVLASYTVTLSFNPHVQAQYTQMISQTGVLHHYVPTLSATLRLLLYPRAVWLQFAPEAFACCWAVWYFWSRQDRWNWLDQGSLVLLVSAVCAPYAWFSDEIVLLPAILYGVYRAVDERRSLWPIAIIYVAALLEICAYSGISSKLYLWTTPAWLGWFVYATWKRTPQSEPVPSGTELVTG